MVMSRSFDNLNDINRSAAAPSVADHEKKKEGNIFSRIFKIRTLQSPSRKKTANKEKSKKKGASANRSSLGAGYEGLAPPDGGQSSLANSLSMPDIAGEFVRVNFSDNTTTVARLLQTKFIVKQYDRQYVLSKSYTIHSTWSNDWQNSADYEATYLIGLLKTFTKSILLLLRSSWRSTYLSLSRQLDGVITFLLSN